MKQLFIFKEELDWASVLLRSNGDTFEIHTKATRRDLFDDPASRATRWWSDTYNFADREYLQSGEFHYMVSGTENPQERTFEIIPL